MRGSLSKKLNICPFSKNISELLCPWAKQILESADAKALRSSWETATKKNIFYLQKTSLDMSRLNLFSSITLRSLKMPQIQPQNDDIWRNSLEMRPLAALIAATNKISVKATSWKETLLSTKLWVSSIFAGSGIPFWKSPLKIVWRVQ